jgi:hypothetical protein
VKLYLNKLRCPGKRSRIEESTDDEDYDIEFEDEIIYRKCILSINIPLSPFDTDQIYPYFETSVAEIGYQNLVDCSLSMKNRYYPRNKFHMQDP